MYNVLHFCGYIIEVWCRILYIQYIDRSDSVGRCCRVVVVCCTVPPVPGGPLLLSSEWRARPPTVRVSHTTLALAPGRSHSALTTLPTTFLTTNRISIFIFGAFAKDLSTIWWWWLSSDLRTWLVAYHLPPDSNKLILNFSMSSLPAVRTTRLWREHELH